MLAPTLRHGSEAGVPTPKGRRDIVHVRYNLNMAFVYILQNQLGKYYIGSTLDIVRRMRHHAGGYTPSTKRMGKMRLVFKQEYLTLPEAREVERKLKRLKRKDYIRKIVEEGYIKIKPE